MKVFFFYCFFLFIFFLIWELLSQIWEKHLFFALGIGAEIRPQNRLRKIPALRSTFAEKGIKYFLKKDGHMADFSLPPFQSKL